MPLLPLQQAIQLMTRQTSFDGGAQVLGQQIDAKR